jgi:hypothetical protein
MDKKNKMELSYIIGDEPSKAWNEQVVDQRLAPFPLPCLEMLTETDIQYSQQRLQRDNQVHK